MVTFWALQSIQGVVYYDINNANALQIRRTLRHIAALVSVLVTLQTWAQPAIDSLSVTDPSCGGTDGSVLIHASGGTSPYLFSIDNGSNTQSDSLFSNLAPGVYQIYVEDDNGFSTAQTVTIYGQGGLSIDGVATTDVTCFGDGDGAVTITVSGGTGNYTFDLVGFGSQSSGTFSGLSGGNYTVVITDTAFCIDTATFTINEPTEVTFTASTTDANCPASDGDITLTAAGGDGNYMYSIDTGNTFQASNTFTGLPADVYIVVIMDGTGCTDTGSVFVNSAAGTGPNLITLNFINPLCNGSNNGSITAFAVGTAPITYSNDGGNNYQAGNTFTNLPPGTYDIMVQDGSGCTVGSSVTIQEPSALVTDVVALGETCAGNDGSITFNTTGGTQPYEYSIDSGAVFGSNNSFTGLTGGTYPYIIRDVNGCTDTGTVVLTSGGGPTITSIDTIQPTCPLTSDGEIVIHAISQGGSIQYSIDGGMVFFPTDSFPSLPSGTYDIILLDDQGCTTSTQIILSGPSTPVAGFSASPTTGIIPLVVSFTDNSIGATGYSWDFGGTGSSSSASPSHTFTAGGSFLVVQTVTDGTCTDTAQMIISVTGEPSITVPNVFTPNGDGFNDVFRPDVVGIETLTGSIYNRYGALIYTWEGPLGAWDGHTYPAGELVSDGVYYYVISAVGIDGTNFEEKGHVTLIRQTALKRP